jgi:hypothetical protein
MGNFNALKEFLVIKHILVSRDMSMSVSTHKHESKILASLCGEIYVDNRKFLISVGFEYSVVSHG